MKRYNEFTPEQLNSMSITDVMLNREIHEQRFYQFKNEAFYWKNSNTLTSEKFTQKAEIEHCEWCLWAVLYRCKTNKKQHHEISKH